ncbi:NUDIX hydrolase [Nonomuraea jiangxiensis]|uniref:8-oxo-dGTP pyrophosphatase MutT, NUDIX family n=1 Tax=Nonomuraea jiangxiensis TaxID=633440 RepID=A0A1G9JCD9_9ACTN|nr:NUDIX domain-containing protein [Nonomuraea jiangxiensis]SDL35317.1 8-oxo-dGTP pyrophosphatase MutT, NUDIX family [Nonomuraea jiangxiensis]
MSEVISRTSARVLLIDPAARILLYRGRLLQVEAPRWAWFTPGGGVDPGETPQQAAARELREELGHAVAPETLGPLVATSEGPWSGGGRRFFSRDYYFLLRVNALDVDTSGMDEEERAATDRFHWWTPAELAGPAPDGEEVVPRELGSLVARLAAGNLPASPIVLPWHLLDDR